MEHSSQDLNSRPAQGARPLWARGVALATIWLLVLQPAVSTAQLAQVPMFTVTSAPPNVMLMFDDSASMNRLDLNPPTAYDNPTVSLGTTNPALKLNTVGYFGISGVRWHSTQGGGWITPGSAAYNNRWTFIRAEVNARSPAFNPLAYNPSIRYLPWNNNGTRFPNASIGGTTNVPIGARTQWDVRNLPPGLPPAFPQGMGGGPVALKLTAPSEGVIPETGATRSWAAPVAGSVRYNGLPSNGLDPAGADLFTSTIQWNNPNCAAMTTPTNYAWACPVGSGTLQAPAAAEVCDAGTVGSSAAGRNCCNVSSVAGIPYPASPTVYFWRNEVPPGPPIPGLTGPGGEFCTSIFPTGATNSFQGAPCTVPVLIDDPDPYEVTCGTMGTPLGGEVCFYDPPPNYTASVCTTYTQYQWGCTYDTMITPFTNVCGPLTAQVCGSSLGTPFCSGGLQPLDPTTDARYVSGHWTPARYVVYDGPATRTNAEIRNMANYRMIMVDRKFGWDGTTQVPSGTSHADAVGKYYVVDGVTGVPAPVGSRPDCLFPNAGTLPIQDGSWCTWQQEAQNYANWYTYYRSRLFAAIAVMSEVTSGLIGPEQFMRMGYGRINYFPSARNPWNVTSVTDRLPGALSAVDGPATYPATASVPAGNPGGVERGVRPFTVFDPPLSVTPNPERQQVFNWLFTINGLGPTPNREALHGAGLYFTRNDSRGPWGNFPGVGGGEASTDHLWCRRNFTLLATDGEWTRLSGGQPLLESAPLAGTRSPMGGAGSVSVSMSIDGPAITGTDRDNPLVPLSYQYLAGDETQITGGFGSTDTETISDVLHYYWSRDLRPEPALRNSIKTSARNRAFWQHMSSYIVGYGVVASMDTPSVRPTFDTPRAAPPLPPHPLITWPQVGPEDCRQLDDNVDDAALTGCAHTVAPSGNRVNDTLRAGLISGGDFFSASSPVALKASLEAAFAAIGSDPAAGTSPGLSSSTVGAGNLIIRSGFNTNVWDGYIRAYDQQLLVTFLTSGGVEPPPLWSINFDLPVNRPIFSSTGINAPIPFEWASLTGPQQTALGSSLELDYLRGDQSRELRFAGGIFRNRNSTILGDIVQSTPLYSKGADHGYARRPAASVVLPAAATQGNTLYPAYVTAKRTTRTPVAIFGANDGMLHILDARRGAVCGPPGSPPCGKEIFAYVPRSLFFTLRDLTSAAYSHRFYVDGPVIESDIFNGTAWKTIAIGTTGAGAAGIFAIDITSPQSGFTAANVMWDIVPSEHADPVVVSDLGNVLQPGIVGSLKDSSVATGGRWVYIVGNGYDSVSKKATLFVFDAFNGSLVKAIPTGVGSAGTPNGLGGITPVFDGSRNIIAVYGGDKLGNMWKFDFSSPFKNDPDGPGPQKGWEIFNQVAGFPAPLFVATDDASVKQPITAAPRITPHGISGLHVGFGTGKLFEAGDQIDVQEQSLYVLWDKGQIPTIPKASLHRINMEDAPWDHDGDGPFGTPHVATGEFRRFVAADLAAYDWTKEGFYTVMNLAPVGEKILSAGFLDAGVMSFTSFAQQAAGGSPDLCTPGGTSHVYRFNLIGGLGEAGFLGVTGPVIGRRVQPGLVSGAPPIYEPITPVGPTKESMTAAEAKSMMSSPAYKQSGGRAVATGPQGTCAHIGLKVDGSMARIPTACAGLMPIRTWRPVR